MERKKRTHVKSSIIAFSAIAIAALSTGAFARHGPTAMAGLRLQPGVYVESSTPCARASAATVTKFDGRNFSGERYTASPTGQPGIFRMQYFETDTGPPLTWPVRILLLGSTSYRWAARGSSHTARLCPTVSWP